VIQESNSRCAIAARVRPLEATLYAPVKEFLESRGYEVKGEVRGCDLVAWRGGEPPIIVELKLRFSLALVLQGIDRLPLTERVYLAVPRSPSRHDARALASRTRPISANCAGGSDWD